jgi:hypothetical protein
MNKYLIPIMIFCLIITPFYQTVGAKTVTLRVEDLDLGDTAIELEPGDSIKLDASQKELNIPGQLHARGNDKAPVIISIANPLSRADILSIPAETVIKRNRGLKELEIQPYRVETKEIVEELEAFRRQYAFVWVVLMGIQIYLVMNRTQYW